MSAIHKRCYAAMKTEFKLLAKVVAQYLPPEYPYDVVGGQRNVKQADFDDRVDIIPVADPNIFSMSQRITLAQTQLQIATSNPQLHNINKYTETCMRLLVLKMLMQFHHQRQQHRWTYGTYSTQAGQKTFSSFPLLHRLRRHHSAFKFYVNKHG